MNEITKKRIYATIFFVIIGFLALQVPLMEIVGSKVRFTLFDAFGPIAGAFLGTVPGVVAVIIMQLVDWYTHGAIVAPATIIHMIPVLFGVWFFSRPTRLTLAVPALCMVAFWTHPEGRGAWIFPLLWLIPFVAYHFKDKFVFARALGATFTAHAVGGALWIWIFNLKSAVWISLIPTVIVERLIFASGIMLVYLLLQSLLRYAVRNKIITGEGLVLKQEN